MRIFKKKIFLLTISGMNEENTDFNYVIYIYEKNNVGKIFIEAIWVVNFAILLSYLRIYIEKKIYI